jgi:Zn-dependent protease with chaperone function
MPDPAVYFDGRSSRRHIVELRFTDGLTIREADATLAGWPFADIRLLEAGSSRMRLGCVSAPPLARLVLSDRDHQDAVRMLCPNLSAPGAVRPVSSGRIVAWSLAAVGVMMAVIWFGIPILADAVADAAPIGLERMLGQAVDHQVRAVFSGGACTNPDGQAALTTLVTALQSKAHLTIPPQPVVLRSSIPNAFALPGGRVYILSTLLAQTRSPDELGGVLAHEFGHVAHRDGLRRLIRDGGTGFLVGALFGDVSGAGAAVFVIRSFLNVAHTREAEASADAFAITVMHGLGRPTAPLAALLERIAGPSETDWGLLRDHPLTRERSAQLRENEPVVQGAVLLSDSQWATLKHICGRSP